MNGSYLNVEAEQRNLLVEAATNAMIIVDDDNTIIAANTAAECLLGAHPGALLGQSADVLELAQIGAVPASRSDDRDPLTILLSRGKLTTRRLDGTLIPVTVSSRSLPSRDGPLNLIVLEEMAQPPADAYDFDPATPLESDRNAKWRFDIATGEFWCAPALYAILGVADGQRPSFDLVRSAFAPIDRNRFDTHVARARADGTPFSDVFVIPWRDGSDRCIICSVIAERAANDELVALVGSVEDVSESKITKRQRQRLEDYIALSNRSRTIGVWELDLLTDRVMWDRNMYQLYGIADATKPPSFELWRETLHPHDRAQAISTITADLVAGAASESEFRIIWENGEVHTIHSFATIFIDVNGTPLRVIGTDWDVTELRMLADALREEKEALIGSEARYRALSEAMPELVWVIDAAGGFDYVNERWSAYTGLTPEGSRALGLDAVVDAFNAQKIRMACAAVPAQEFECEVRLRRSDGVYRWHLIRGVPFKCAPGDSGKWMITATDIEERKDSEYRLAATMAELEHRVHHDPMTNLPNRVLLLDRLTHAMASAARTAGNVVVVYVDLDRFKAINDSMGHTAGDSVIRETGARIVQTLRAGDTASRVGGDEFIVLCQTDGNGAEISRITERLLAAVSAPLAVAGEKFTLGASIGVSVYPVDGTDADTLIQKADAAMYAAKEAGGGTVRRYSPEAHSAIVAAATFEAELRHATGAGQLIVHYQPILNLQTQRPSGAEVLVRWQHPQRGLLAPAAFIPFAEECGLVAQIGDVVLDAAGAMLERLRAAGLADMSIAVNVSAQQFGRAGFVETIVSLLQRYACDPRLLTIEITESTVMANTPTTLDQLRDLGVNLSIDDFGTGYSSLAYIKKFPISALKIDRSFVNDIAFDATDQAIAKTIITLAHSLDMTVIAEGVETQEQLETLGAFGVDSIQGYLVSKPIPADDFVDVARALSGVSSHF